MKTKLPTDPVQNALLMRFAIAIAVTFVAMKIHAEITINFGSAPFGTNLKSDDSAMDTSFTFELGTFAGGFDPTDANTDQWLANWVAVQDSGGSTLSGAVVPYDTITVLGLPSDGFNSSVALDHNNTPFEIGSQGYIWGYDNTSLDGEADWLLFTNTDWTFKDGSPDALSFTEAWDIGAADEAVVGDINFFDNEGDFISMQAESVGTPPVVPEPSTAVILGAAFSMFCMRRRRPRYHQRWSAPF